MEAIPDPPSRRRGPKLPELALTDDERATLERWARRAKSSQALALRCRIVLACAEGASNHAVAARLGMSRPTVTKWRSRFVTHRLEGLADEPRPGAARTITDEQVERVLLLTLETAPPMPPTGRPGAWRGRWACRSRPSPGSGGRLGSSRT